jgi:hypothetical protein
MAKRRTKVEIDETRMGKNPLIHSEFKVNIKVISRTKKVVELDNIQQEEEIVSFKNVFDHQTIFSVEADSFVKLFDKADYRDYIFSLPPRAVILFFWIAYTLKPGKDYVFLNKKLAMEKTNMSHVTFKESLDELIRYTLLCPTVYKDYYWINPTFNFKGSRLEKFKENINIV